jgi:molybdopterin-guanine dinucleotide biosynthesis protein A
MIGVIMCGGESSRMGKDKGLLPMPTLPPTPIPFQTSTSTQTSTSIPNPTSSPNQIKTWAALAIEKMSTLEIPVAISVNNRQKETYERVFIGTELIPDDLTLSLKGPLAGLLSVHLHHPTEDLFVLACDLPLMESALLANLYHRYLQNKHSQAYLYTSDGEPEPLCGIYTADALKIILRLYYDQQLTKHSLKFMLEQLTVERQSIPENKKHCFANFNTIPDIRLAQDKPRD